MISVNHYDQMSANDRAVEISRILNAFTDEVIYSVTSNDPRIEVIETLFKVCGVQFRRIIVSDKVQFQKL